MKNNKKPDLVTGYVSFGNNQYFPELKMVIIPCFDTNMEDIPYFIHNRTYKNVEIEDLPQFFSLHTYFNSYKAHGYITAKEAAEINIEKQKVALKINKEALEHTKKKLKTAESVLETIKKM